MSVTDLVSPWYIDVRPPHSEHLKSLDLARHLPPRLASGTVLVVAENPRVTLIVIRKRWMTILREVERHQAQTLNKRSREHLRHELDHMRSKRFTSKWHVKQHPADVFVVSPEQLDNPPPGCLTLYITCTLTSTQFAQAVSALLPGGLVVVYE